MSNAVCAHTEEGDDNLNCVDIFKDSIWKCVGSVRATWLLVSQQTLLVRGICDCGVNVPLEFQYHFNAAAIFNICKRIYSDSSANDKERMESHVPAPSPPFGFVCISSTRNRYYLFTSAPN